MFSKTAEAMDTDNIIINCNKCETKLYIKIISPNILFT